MAVIGWVKNLIADVMQSISFDHLGKSLHPFRIWMHTQRSTPSNKVGNILVVCRICRAVVRMSGMALAASLVGCGDPSYTSDELQAEVRPFLSAAESVGATATVTYVYPELEYERIKAGLTSILRAQFKSLDPKDLGPDQYDLQTETVSFEKKTKHQKRCTSFVRKRSARMKVSTVTIQCEVRSYWTRWNKPPTHSLGDYLDWKADYYHDNRATLIESIKIQEALREKLGYEFSQVVRFGEALVAFDNKALENALGQSNPPWCTRSEVARQFVECAEEAKRR